MIKNSAAARMLAVVVLCALLASCGGGGAAKPSPSSQGFIPAPAQSATSKASPTAAASPSPVATVASMPTISATPDVQASAQASGCAITSFAKIKPPHVTDPLFPQWYGQGSLWFAPSSIYAGAGFQALANDSVWFQGITPTVLLASQPPKITGHLTNDPSASLSTSAGEGELLPTDKPQEPVHGVNISLPKPGCWQLSLASGSQTLEITLWALPITQRPDVVNLTNARKSMTAYPVPASCQVTQWSGPADRGGPFIADYWINGQGMSVDTYVPVFFASVSGMVMVYGNFPNQPAISGQLAGNTVGALRASWIEHSGATRSSWQGTLLFSNPGCWKVSVTDGSARVDATIYVYPAECAPTGNSNNARPCKPPA